MTPAEFFAALSRRWYAVVAMLIAVAASCMFLWPGQHVYSARGSVTFLWPGSISLSKTDDGGLAALVNFAAMVRLAIDDGQAQESTSFGGSLVGAGVRNGFTVVLPNSGGQWSAEYNQPRLQVESVAATPDVAAAKASSLIQEITAAASELQARLSIPPDAFISTSVSSVEVVDGGASLSTRMRGEASLVSIGVFLTGVVIIILDRFIRHRKFVHRGRRTA